MTGRIDANRRVAERWWCPLLNSSAWRSYEYPTWPKFNSISPRNPIRER
jgi:hypothetical protein